MDEDAEAREKKVGFDITELNNFYYNIAIAITGIPLMMMLIAITLNLVEAFFAESDVV